MSVQIEDGRPVSGHSGPVNDVGVGQPAHKRWVVAGIAFIVVAALLASGIWSRVKDRSALSAETAQVALTSVSVVSPQRTAPAQEIILPGNVQPYITSPIYSRTNGYLQKWYVDIGARVKQGWPASRTAASAVG